MALRPADRLRGRSTGSCCRGAFRAAQGPADGRSRSWRATAGVLAWLLCLAAPLAAQQADRARTETQARRATERLQALQREAERLAADERTLLNDLRRLEVERQIKAAEVKQADADVTAVEEELRTATARMNEIRESDLASRPELRMRLVEMYKLGRARYLRLLLSTPDLRRIGQAMRTVAALAKLDQDRVARYKQTLAELSAARTDLEARSVQLRAVRAESERAELAAARAATAKDDLIREIDSRRDLNAQLSSELLGAQQKLQAALRSLASGTPVTEAPALPFRPFKGDLDWPVTGTVRRRFGRTAGPNGSSSNGIEIAAEETASAQAIHEGVVAFADNFGGFGKLVILDHGSQTFSLYGDLLEVAVTKGTRVERGQVVGAVGPTPTGAAGLYFELRVDGRPVDPLQWLRKR